MIKSWGIYLCFGEIRITKKVGCLLEAKKKYDQIMKRKKKPGLMIAIVPIYDIKTT